MGITVWFSVPRNDRQDQSERRQQARALVFHLSTHPARETPPGPLTPAQNRALTEDSLREQLNRLGQTPYELTHLTADIKADIFAPASLLNQLRREAVEKLQTLQSNPNPLTL